MPIDIRRLKCRHAVAQRITKTSALSVCKTCLRYSRGRFAGHPANIKLQGETVARSVDVARETGGPRRALVKEFRINTKRDMEIEFNPKIGEPILSGLKIISDQAR